MKTIHEWRTESGTTDQRILLECPVCKLRSSYDRPKNKTNQRIVCQCKRAAVTIHWAGDGGYSGPELILQCRKCGGAIEEPTRCKTLCNTCRLQVAGERARNQKKHRATAWQTPEEFPG